MTTRAFKKIMAGLDDARGYLDGTAKKRRYRVRRHPQTMRTRKMPKIKRVRDS